MFVNAQKKTELEMANTIVMTEEGYGFNYEWIAAGSGIGEEICGVDKDCIVVPSSPELHKIQIEPPELGDDYVEIQVTEEEVVADQWNSHAGSEEDGLNLNVDTSHDDDVMVPLPEDQDEYSRLHPYPCDFCSRRFSKKSALTVHMVSHQVERPHGCNMCGAQYRRKHDLVEHMKIHAYAPIKIEPEDDYEELPTLPQAKAKQRARRKKRSIKKFEFDETIAREKKTRPPPIPFDDFKFEIDIPQVEEPKFPIIDPSRPYVCQQCGIGFAREKALTSHTMIHVGDSAYECESCGEMFQSESQLEQHNSIRHGQVSRKRDDNYGTFLCNECGASFQWYNQLKKHRKSHIKQEEQDDEENHLCTLCNVVFNTLDELLCHKEDHDPEIGVHSCYLCGEVYENMTDLRDHMKTRHKANHMCHLCEKMFKDSKALNKHLASHIETRTFPCSICSRRFHNKAKLKKHMISHDDIKPNGGMVCRECGEMFTEGQSLLNHRQAVHGVNISRMFPCLQCGKAFNSRSSHQIHLRIHTGERPYACKYCWKAFGDGGTLRKHERIHTGEKPYVCPVCTKAFNQRVVLREHIRAHHSGSESRLSNNCYECMVCGSVLAASSELCAHLVLHSDENTAKHRVPKGNRKYVRKKKYTGFEEDSGSPVEDDRRKTQLASPPPPPTQIVKYSEELDTVIKIEPGLTPTNTDLNKGRARIVRSGRKGVPKGQNKRYARGKTKAARLMNNTSYASKYVVSCPENADMPSNLESSLNGIVPRSRPRTKNVSYHNMKAEPRYELATFPVDSKRCSSGNQKKRSQVRRDILPSESVENQYVNGIDLFEETGGEQIETCIVDDIDVELKLEVKTSEPEECLISPDDIKTELVSCDMCSEVFTSRSDLLKHIQIHI